MLKSFVYNWNDFFINRRLIRWAKRQQSQTDVSLVRKFGLILIFLYKYKMLQKMSRFKTQTFAECML